MVLVYVILLLVAALLAICGCCCLPCFKRTIRQLGEILGGLPDAYNAAVVAVIGMMVFGCYWMVDPALQDRAVYSHVVKGRCPKLPEQAYHVNRTEERAAVQKAILNADKGFYYVITGPHGCGKSFLVQETVLELMTNSTPIPGLLYLVAANGYPIANAIRDVLVENGNTLLGAIQQIARSFYTIPELYSLPDDLAQGMWKICVKLDQLGGKISRGVWQTTCNCSG